MKRMCLAALLLLLFPVLASAEMVSISELREQAEAMGGRWKKTYEAHGRTIEVDAPVIVPEVEAVPVAVVEGRRAQAMEGLRELVPASRRSADDDRECIYTLTGEELGAAGRAGDVLTFYDPDEIRNNALFSVRFNQTKNAPVPGTVEKYAKYFPWQLDEQTAYAEDNPATYGDALEALRKVSEWVYPEEETGVSAHQVTIYDRQRKYKGANYETVGEPVEGSTIGRYAISCEQTLYGIPLVSSIKMGINDTAVTVSKDRRDYNPGFTFSYLSPDTYHVMNLGVICPREVRFADVPLASLDDVLASIEAEIEAGHVRAVYSLGLKYVLCEDQKGEFLVYPAWIMEGLYVENPKEELTTKYGPIGEHFDDPVEFGGYPIFAQSAEFGSPKVVQAMLCAEDGRGQRLAMPELVTWEDVK